ncbi:hypothetical protein AB0K60_11280 [Thermopolyspora sp. NPDC052614]|uniref:hypothetical protein n=1 Tax=Thermopolyspora sp. NPDC052614 TaxID=3155682 RepID=UPI00341CF9C8
MPMDDGATSPGFSMSVRVSGPLGNGARQTSEDDVTIVGRLHMGDFSPATLRCRIDTYAGSVLADFDSELRDAVLEAMDQLVMASGRAEVQPDGSTVRIMHLEAVQRLTGASTSPLSELAHEQGVGPIRSIEELRGDPIDGFLL